MINKASLEKSIENLRERLHTLLSYKEPTDAAVVKCSQELDKLLVDYEKSHLLPSSIASHTKSA